MAWTLEIMRGLDCPQASLGTATALPCSPPSIIFTSPVLFLFDLTECIILHLFACLFPVFSLAINAVRRDHSCVIHHCGQFLNSVQHTQTHYILNKYLLNNGRNQFCDSFMYSNNMDALTRTRTSIFTGEKVDSSLTSGKLGSEVGVWRWAGYLPASHSCRLLLQGVYKAERKLSLLSTSSALDAGPGQLTKTYSCSLKLALHSASHSLHRWCWTFWKK